MNDQRRPAAPKAAHRSLLRVYAQLAAQRSPNKGDHPFEQAAAGGAQAPAGGRTETSAAVPALLANRAGAAKRRGGPRAAGDRCSRCPRADTARTNPRPARRGRRRTLHSVGGGAGRTARPAPRAVEGSRHPSLVDSNRRPAGAGRPAPRPVEGRRHPSATETNRATATERRGGPAGRAAGRRINSRGRRGRGSNPSGQLIFTLRDSDQARIGLGSGSDRAPSCDRLAQGARQDPVGVLPVGVIPDWGPAKGPRVGKRGAPSPDSGSFQAP